MADLSHYFRLWENHESLCLKYLRRKIITNCKPCKQWFKINYSQSSSVLQRLPLWWNPINTCVGVYQTWKVIEFCCLLHSDKLYKNQTSKYSNICIASDNNSQCITIHFHRETKANNHYLHMYASSNRMFAGLHHIVKYLVTICIIVLCLHVVQA
jgi:hypothetical protein